MYGSGGEDSGAVGSQEGGDGHEGVGEIGVGENVTGDVVGKMGETKVATGCSRKYILSGGFEVEGREGRGRKEREECGKGRLAD